MFELSSIHLSGGLQRYVLAIVQDYQIAEGYNNATVKGHTVIFEAKYYFSQDGARSVTSVSLLAFLGCQFSGQHLHQ